MKADVKARGEDGEDKIFSIVDNAAEGTVTITMNDDAKTQYTFRKASTAVSFAILNAGRLEIGVGTTSVVRFAVNPSNASISTNTADWMLCDVNTGTDAVNFTLESNAPDGAIAGQYTVAIRCNTAVETVVALKLNAGTAAAPAWVSSSACKIGIAPKIAMTTSISGGTKIAMSGTGTVTID